MTADAADLPAQSRLGAIFAEPPPPAVVYRTAEYVAPIIPYNQLAQSAVEPGQLQLRLVVVVLLSRAPITAGPIIGDGARLPYVCGFYGYC